MGCPAQGGSFYIVERNGHKIFQRPATLGLGPSPAPPASTLTPGVWRSNPPAPKAAEGVSIRKLAHLFEELCRRSPLPRSTRCKALLAGRANPSGLPWPQPQPRITG